MNVAIIAAGGRGARMGGGRAKQFLELSGIPIIVRTLKRFELCESVVETIAVVPAGETSAVLELAAKHELKKLARAVAGGATRTESVWRGLQTVDADDDTIIAIHDAVRPFISPSEIDATVREAERSGAAILAARAVDTIKEADEGRVVRTLERARLWHAQTPQCFRLGLLRRAYKLALAENIEATDDSSLVERIGAHVAIVEGGTHNIKITTRQDLSLAEELLGSEQ